MPGYFKVCLAVYWLGLGLWLAALVAATISAVHAFTVLPALEPALPAFGDFPASEHGTIAAGKMMADVFFTVDLVQIVAAPLVVITLALQLTVFRLPVRRVANLVRTACLAIAALLLAWHVLAVAPRMNGLLRDYWAAAEAGQVQEARTLQASFQADHRTAETILGADLLLVVIAVIGSAAALSPNLAEPGNRT